MACLAMFPAADAESTDVVELTSDVPNTVHLGSPFCDFALTICSVLSTTCHSA